MSIEISAAHKHGSTYELTAVTSTATKHRTITARTAEELARVKHRFGMDIQAGRA